MYLKISNACRLQHLHATQQRPNIIHQAYFHHSCQCAALNCTAQYLQSLFPFFHHFEKGTSAKFAPVDAFLIPFFDPKAPGGTQVAPLMWKNGAFGIVPQGDEKLEHALDAEFVQDLWASGEHGGRFSKEENLDAAGRSRCVHTRVRESVTQIVEAKIVELLKEY